MRYEYLYQEAVFWVKAIYHRMAAGVLALGGVALVIMWWMFLPPHLPDIPQEGKAERARQLELAVAGLSKQTGEEETADAIPEQASNGIAKMDSTASPAQAKKGAPPPAEQVQIDPMVKAGMKVYKEFECYNCHKIAGKGWKKRKGPELDNIGNLVSAELLKKKLLDPWVFSTEGFDKEYQKPVMPNNYTKLMSDKEMDAVVAYMMTLKNPGAKTPKPIFDPKRPDL
ncbi:MAG: cytochrome c [Nitrospirae bacterium]|nr:cytochrome c [Nitrospirota bacterium]